MVGNPMRYLTMLWEPTYSADKPGLENDGRRQDGNRRFTNRDITESEVVFDPTETNIYW